MENAAGASGGGSSGAVITASFDEGSVFVRDSNGRIVRLAWEARDETARNAMKARTLPAGEYTLIGYRIVDRSRAGEVWHVAASGTKLRKLEVPESGEMRIEVSARISVRQRFDGSSAGMEIRGSDGAGASIYKNGARIPIGYRILGAQGEQLALGKMNYG